MKNTNDKLCIVLMTLALLILLLIADAHDWRLGASDAVTVAQIQADRDIQIARIEADATKKTSWAYVAFYLVRYGVWVVLVLWVVVAALALLVAGGFRS